MTQISLKDFRDAVEARLAVCSIDDLRAILRSMAEATAIEGREAFLRALGAKVPMDLASDELLGRVRVALASLPPAAPSVPAGVAAGALLEKITELTEDYEESLANPPEPEYSDNWYDSDDVDEDAYEVYAPRFVQLFDLTAAAYDYGDFETAVEAYETLFGSVKLEDEYGRSVASPLFERMDIKSVVTRYLRAVYQMTLPEVRPARVLSAMRFIKTEFPYQCQEIGLDDLAQISPGSLPEWERFLADYIAALQAEPVNVETDGWLREAVRWAQGEAGLAALALDQGMDHPLAYLDWFQSLQVAGKWSELLTAAREAMQRLPVNWSVRARIADYLCMAAAHLNELEALHWGRWEAFTVEPKLGRLLDLWDSAPPEPERTALMQRAQGYLADYKPLEKEPLPWQAQTRYSSSWLRSHAALLAGDWNRACEIGIKERDGGSGSGGNAALLVVGALLVFLSEHGAGALSTNLERLWLETLPDYSNPDAVRRCQLVYRDRFAGMTMPPVQQEAFLAVCLEMLERWVQGIVGGQQRKSYGWAALLTRVGSEVLTFRQGAAAGKAFELKIREQFPRHSAFQAEFKMPLGKARA